MWRAAIDRERDWKQEAVRLWGHDPCESRFGAALKIGSLEFFQAVERRRYQECPWLRSVVEFDRYAGKRVLEIGIGMGTDHLQFARGGADPVGIDLTPRCVQLTARHLWLHDFRPRLLVADAEELALKDGSVDFVYSMGVLHHTPDIQKAVDEIYRVLKDGTEALVILYHRHSLFHWWSIRFVERILGRGFLRESLSQRLSRIEYSRIGARPLVKLYARRDARRLFRRFGAVEVQVKHLRRQDIAHLGPYIPSRFLQRLERRFGWYLVIRACKGSKA